MRDKSREPTSKKAPFLRAAEQLARETLALLCREKVFPKRSRWLLGKPMADLVSAYYSEAMTANGIRVQTAAEFVERHRHQTLAIAQLYSLNAMMGLAQAVLSINPDDLDYWATLLNEADRCTKAWMNSDEKRYGAIYGPIGEPAISAQPVQRQQRAQL